MPGPPGRSFILPGALTIFAIAVTFLRAESSISKGDVLNTLTVVAVKLTGTIPLPEIKTGVLATQLLPAIIGRTPANRRARWRRGILIGLALLAGPSLFFALMRIQGLADQFDRAYLVELMLYCVSDIDIARPGRDRPLLAAWTWLRVGIQRGSSGRSGIEPRSRPV